MLSRETSLGCLRDTPPLLSAAALPLDRHDACRQHCCPPGPRQRPHALAGQAQKLSYQCRPYGGQGVDQLQDREWRNNQSWMRTRAASCILIFEHSVILSTRVSTIRPTRLSSQNTIYSTAQFAHLSLRRRDGGLPLCFKPRRKGSRPQRRVRNKGP